MNVSEKLREIFVNLFFIAESEINDQLSQEDVGAWDSLQHLNLVLSIEEEFGISVTPEESTEMLNFGLVAMLIEEKLRKNKEEPSAL